MHLECHGDIGSGSLHDPSIVLEAGPVRRADVDESGAALFHDLGNPKRTSDLHALSAAHCHRAAAAQSRDHEQDGGGIVVDHECGLGADQSRDEQRCTPVSGSPPSGGEIEFDRVGAIRDVHRHRSPAQVRVQDDSGGIDDPCRQCPGQLSGSHRRRVHIASGDRATSCVHEEGMG